MVIGDIESLAFEFLRRSETTGEVYLIVRGKRIGMDCWDYELSSLKRAFYYECGDVDRRRYPELVGFSSRDMAKLLYCVMDEYSDERCEEFKKLNIVDEDIDKIFFYSIPYLFDGWGVGLVQGDEVENFFVFDEDKEVYLDVKLKAGGFYSLVMSLTQLF